MNIPKVSIIIPVYNTEAYVEETLRSIMNQTLQEIEIIVINDGSTDESLPIVINMSLLDSRIKIINQNNKGLSGARNAGIYASLGEYLYFMDSDDLLDKETLEDCYKLCKEKDLDFVFFDAEIFNYKNQYNLQLNYQRSHLIIPGSVDSGLNLLDLQLKNNVFTSSSCLNFINHQFIKTHNLYFFPGIIHEDQLFTFQLYSVATKVSCIQKSYFKRRIREDSIMTRHFTLSNMTGYFTVAHQLLINREMGSEQLKKTTDMFLTQMLNATSYNASTLPLRDRLFITKHFLKKYRRYVSLKSILRILFKDFIR